MSEILDRMKKEKRKPSAKVAPKEQNKVVPQRQSVIQSSPRPSKIMSYPDLITWVQDHKNDFATDLLRKFYYNCEQSPKKHWRSIVQQVLQILEMSQTH